MVRVALFLALGTSILFTLAGSLLWPRPHGLGPTVAWWLTISGVATAAMLVTKRSLRRFLPIVALLRMTLVFPDAAPSRFRVALRSGTTHQLEQRARSGDLDGATQYAAEALPPPGS